MGEKLNKIRVRYVVVDDINFESHFNPVHIDMLSTDEVGDMVEAIWSREPALQQYPLSAFTVLRIRDAVPETYRNGSEVSGQDNKGERLSLEPILQRLRDRSSGPQENELANEHVRVLNGSDDIGDFFKPEERKLISAIVVRLATPGASS